MNRDPERKITVEDLIRLKRAERPPVEYWSGFETQMRAKQLAAIVVKRPWWDGPARILSAVWRHPMPIGAAAALALAFVGVRYVGGAGHVSTQAVVREAGGAPAPAVSAQLARQEAVSRAQPVVVAAAEAPRAMPVAETASVGAAHAEQVAVSGASDRTPIAEGIYVTLADLRDTTPVLPQRDVFGSDRDFEATFSPRQQVPEPLARMDPAAERRARLLAPALPAYASSSPRPVSGSLIRERLNDDRIYESMDLYGSSERTMVGFRF
jgi:hypothetical protein